MTIAKWLPAEMQGQKDVFHRCKELQVKIQELCFDCGEILKECTAKSISKEQVIAEDAVLNVSFCSEIISEIYKRVRAIIFSD